MPGYIDKPGKDPRFALGNDWYALPMPVGGDNATPLATIKALTAAGRLRSRPSDLEAISPQLWWYFGYNPFGKSLMQGQGRLASNYHAYSGYVVGALPVGIRSRDRYTPHWPGRITWRFREIWTHPTGLLLWTLADVWPEAARAADPVRRSLTRSGEGRQFEIDASLETAENRDLTLRLFNLKKIGQSKNTSWSVRVQDHGKRWVAVLMLDGTPVADLSAPRK